MYIILSGKSPEKDHTQDLGIDCICMCVYIYIKGDGYNYACMLYCYGAVVVFMCFHRDSSVYEAVLSQNRRCSSIHCFNEEMMA
jgi:hypothetical protein